MLTLLGIPINVNASWVLIYALVTWTLAVGYFPRQLPGLEPVAYWVSGILAGLLLFVSVLIHELAHAVTARAHGVGVSGITLHLLGGVSQLDDEPPDPRTEVQIALAGPLTSVALAAALALVRLGVEAPWGQALLNYLIAVNVAVGLFNLIPGFPLDGGRVLHAVAWRVTGDRGRATAIAGRVGMAVAVGLMALGALQAFAGALLSGLWLVLIGLFLRQAAAASTREVGLREALASLSVADVMTEDVITIPWRATVADLAGEFWTHHVTSFPVVDGTVVRGVATVHDVGRVSADERERTSVQSVMRPVTGALTISPSATALEALQRATGNGLGRLAVVDAGRLVGYLSLRDLTHVLALRSVPGLRADVAPAERPARRAA